MKPAWRKSKRSDTQGNACVELAKLPGGKVGVRDSKNPDDGHQELPAETARRFLDAVRGGAYDL